MEKKTANKIQVGDVIAIYGRNLETWPGTITHENEVKHDSVLGIAYNASFPIFKYVEVVSITKCDQMSWDGNRVCKQRYEFFCSDGRTYSVTSGATKYPVNEGKP